MKVRLFDYTTQLYEYLLEHEEADTVDPVLFERLVKRSKKQVLKKSSVLKSKTLADKIKDDKKKRKEKSNHKDQEKTNSKNNVVDKKKGEPTIEFNTGKNKKNTENNKVVNLGPINSRMIGQLVKLLREGPVRFSYKKKNNERRNAIGTLEPDVVRKHIKGTGAPKPPTVLPYIDLNAGGNGSPTAKPNYDKAAWRSFRKNLLQSFKPISM